MEGCKQIKDHHNLNINHIWNVSLFTLSVFFFFLITIRWKINSTDSVSPYNLNMVVRGTSYQPKQTKKIEQKCKTLSLVSYIIIHKYMPPRVCFFWALLLFRRAIKCVYVYSRVLIVHSFSTLKKSKITQRSNAVFHRVSQLYTLLSLNQHLLKPHVFQAAPRIRCLLCLARF